MAQIAAKAMGLSITNLSSVRPFTDTTDPYVQALNAAGIVGGYFDNGTSTYKPYNTLTRGADVRHRLADGAVPVNRKKQRTAEAARCFSAGREEHYFSSALYTSRGMVNSTMPI